jgi:hypothetical protein
VANGVLDTYFKHEGWSDCKGVVVGIAIGTVLGPLAQPNDANGEEAVHPLTMVINGRHHHFATIPRTYMQHAFGGTHLITSKSFGTLKGNQDYPVLSNKYLGSGFIHRGHQINHYEGGLTHALLITVRFTAVKNLSKKVLTERANNGVAAAQPRGAAHLAPVEDEFGNWDDPTTGFNFTNEDVEKEINRLMPGAFPSHETAHLRERA